MGNSPLRPEDQMHRLSWVISWPALITSAFWTQHDLTGILVPKFEHPKRLLQTIHRNVSAIDPMRAPRGDEHNHIRHLVSGAETAHRKTVADVVLEIPRVGQAVAVPPVPSDQDRARRNRVHPYAIRHEFQRPALGLEDQRRLGRTVLARH